MATLEEWATFINSIKRVAISGMLIVAAVIVCLSPNTDPTTKGLFGGFAGAVATYYLGSKTAKGE